jgi:lipoprotein-anchoring transpeptidase ErfK/SrfK
MHMHAFRASGVLSGMAGSLLLAFGALAEPLGSAVPARYPATIFQQVLPYRGEADGVESAEVPAHLRHQVIENPTNGVPGTIVIDTANTYLYLVLGGGKALRYGIGVGREGFTWAGAHAIERKGEWPDWIPPSEMISRQPYLPRFVAGGPGNPLGARALYLSGTLYRIHGTNQPTSIGYHVSSGCIRMTNADVIDLYDRVQLRTKVVVLPDRRRSAPTALVSGDATRAPVSSGAMRTHGLYWSGPERPSSPYPSSDAERALPDGETDVAAIEQ